MVVPLGLVERGLDVTALFGVQHMYNFLLEIEMGLSPFFMYHAASDLGWSDTRLYGGQGSHDRGDDC